MTELADINVLETILDNSVSVAMLAYFIWKQERYDRRFLENLRDVKENLNEIKTSLHYLRPAPRKPIDPFQ